jgi:predicted nuclease of predicted toxin-antitoxin system
MLWLADECIAASLVRALRDADHDVLYIAEFAASLSDLEVIALAVQEKRLLLTADKDFGELVFRRGQAVPGLGSIRSIAHWYWHGCWVLSTSSVIGSSAVTS